MGDRGFSDIAAGAPVSVRDENNTLIGTGQLSPGYVDLSQEPYTCHFPWLVHGVPRGHTFYQVEVAKRGAVNVKDSDLGSPINSTLG